MVNELYRFLFYFSFLALFFCSLITYGDLLLHNYAISYIHYGYGLLEAFVLAKIIILGQHLHLGEKFDDSPLIIPTLYKTFIFSVFALILTSLEHFFIGYLHGKDMAKIYDDFLSAGLDIDLAKALVIFLVFFIFFAFTETARVFGYKKFTSLFLYRK